MGISSERRGESVRFALSSDDCSCARKRIRKAAPPYFPGWFPMPFVPLHLDTPLVQTAPGYSASGKPLWLKLDAACRLQ
ncbi:serine dehydratase, partial [Rhizobium ruizarguesonis]